MYNSMKILQIQNRLQGMSTATRVSILIKYFFRVKKYCWIVPLIGYFVIKPIPTQWMLEKISNPLASLVSITIKDKMPMYIRPLTSQNISSPLFYVCHMWFQIMCKLYLTGKWGKVIHKRGDDGKVPTTLREQNGLVTSVDQNHGTRTDGY